MCCGFRPCAISNGATGTNRFGAVADFKADFDTLPMIYNSVIRRDLIDELRSKVGRVFPSTSPDVYTGFAFAYLDKAFLSVTSR